MLKINSLTVAFTLCLGVNLVRGQQEIGFLEKFATASDRRVALQDLIPGTEEYFYYHCLHYQNEGQLAEAQAMLNQWRGKNGESQPVAQMDMRQMLLSYSDNPQRTLDYLRDRLGLDFNHAPPSKDQAADLPNAFDNGPLATEQMLARALAEDPSLSRIETSGLVLLMDKRLTPDQLRTLVQRADRADWPKMVDRIAEELKLKDTRGFGWARVHGRLTLNQLEQLQKLMPQLLENDNFVRTYCAHLAPVEGSSLADQDEMRSYLQRLLAFARKLPASQNSFKALVIGNLLRLDMSAGKYDRKLFLEYLALPRNAVYYDMQRFRNQAVPMAELGYTMNPQVALPPMGDDTSLVRRYLDEFFKSADNVDGFATLLNRDYLDRVFAETKILFGIGDAATWYAKLDPSDQKSLRERVELRFAPQNQNQYSSTDKVSLLVEMKNVPQLIVKIYQINTLNQYRNQPTSISTDIDLDGLVANVERKFEYSQPAQLRHAEKIDLPELDKRGVWVVDLLGGGQRSRAVIQKGNLIALQRLSDAGHVFQVIDETGQLLKSAHIEMNGRSFEADSEGRIFLPYGEQTVTRNLLLVDNGFASLATIMHQSEVYQLQAGFVLDRQSLVAGKQALLAVRTRLFCNGRPISIKLLEESSLTIVATDIEGVATTQVVNKLDLQDADEFVHKFLVPQRLASVRFELTGRVYNQSRDERQSVAASYSVDCNGIQGTGRIADVFLRSSSKGYRLFVLGRNGEPFGRMPVSVSVKRNHFASPVTSNLASDEKGVVELGELVNVSSIAVTGQDLTAANFDLHRFHRAWPTTIHAGLGAKIVLPLGKEATTADQFAIYEMRRGVPFASETGKLKLANGAVEISDLPTGDFILHDYEAGQQVSIFVANAKEDDAILAAKHRVLQSSQKSSVVIRSAKIEGGKLMVELSGADESTRVHLVANALYPDNPVGRQLQMPFEPLMQQSRVPSMSLYVDSLRLDEEYSYILDRQGFKKYPGNMLAQPTLLVRPWEVSVTENADKAAAAGDAMSKMAAPAPSAANLRAEGMGRDAGATADSKCFDFLATPTALSTNLEVENGKLVYAIDGLKGYSSLSIVVVQDNSSDSRDLVLPETELMVRDQRLRSAFPRDQHLAQSQRVEWLAANEKKLIGDPRTRRVQTYASIADVYRLYGTLLNNPEWDKFRFVTQWHQLSEEQKRARYNEMACHELNFFLYNKDRKFFDSVVKPLVSQKLEKQLVDHWLLGDSLESFDQLWRVQRLNTLEKILLARSIQARKPGTARWLSDYEAAFPIEPQARARRFEAALRGMALDTGKDNLSRAMLAQDYEMQGAVNSFGMPSDASGNAPFGGMGGGMAGADPYVDGPAQAESGPAEARAGNKLNERQLGELRRRSGAADAKKRFGIERKMELGKALMFTSLDKTREWAETQYYRIRLQQQTAALIPAGSFWREYFEATDKGSFLPKSMDLPTSSINEALCALAVIDLPLDGVAPEASIENDQLSLTAKQPAIAFVESIEKAAESDGKEPILVGQDIYVGNSGDENELPMQGPLLRGVAYRACVVVTNPTNSKRLVQVLTQLPAGSMPLAASKLTRNTPLELLPYSTSRVNYFFYFPSEGEFEHYGSQISVDGKHIVATESKSHRVLAKPDSVDETTWSYVADWGTSEQVLEFLKKTNLMKIDLNRIVYRMRDKAFFSEVTQLLAARSIFHPGIWTYAVLHNDANQIQPLLQNRPDVIGMLGAAFTSPLVKVDPLEQMSYEHLDYKPLVVARVHRLGPKPLILNSSLFAQYNRLLDVVAHRPAINNEQQMALCYYLILQNRIDEALEWFSKVDSGKLASKLQYDYFDAYLGFYRGQYEKAAQLASNYSEYPVLMWKDLFAQVGDQVRQRKALQAGQDITSVTSLDGNSNRQQRILTDGREARQTEAAAETPTLDLTSQDGRVTIDYRNLSDVRVNYYLMDIELLFSRNPFVARSGDKVPVIEPNLSATVKLDQANGSQRLEMPEQLKNRNLLVEVTSKGISRSTVITANSLAVTVVEPFGRIQVLSAKGRSPLEQAYVKVYGRNKNGNVVFFKDGYTDLRGQFDYATLSTSALDNVDRFAILVLHENQGAVVREASPPTK